ncbi:MAG: hypothetical protein JW849_02980, partial [Phycisphaerae bacterium]|nr:hypothetical protein [Phycisphaerae bacterium]
PRKQGNSEGKMPSVLAGRMPATLSKRAVMGGKHLAGGFASLTPGHTLLDPSGRKEEKTRR